MRLSLFFAAISLLSFNAASAAEHERGEHAEKSTAAKAEGKGEKGEKGDKGDKGEKNDEAARERAVTTSHSVNIGGRSIAYRATAGTLTIRDDKGKPDASVFYVAYTVGEGGTHRPVTFLYNGGPGSASIWLHMGSFGPVRVATTSP